MGVLRKTLWLGTGGMSGAVGIKANSKKARTAKALEWQVRQQKKQMRLEKRQAALAMRQQRPVTRVAKSPAPQISPNPKALPAPPQAALPPPPAPEKLWLT